MTATQNPAQDSSKQVSQQDVSAPALIEFSRIKLWFFRDLVDAQRKALFLLCGFSDAVTHGELDTHSAQLRALRHALRIDAARELQQAQVVGESELDAKAKAMFDAQKDPLAAPWERQWSETIKYWREKAATPQSSAPVVGERAADWASYNAAVAEYVDDYEYMGETEDGREGCYTPTERERMLILDAMNGFELLPPVPATKQDLRSCTICGLTVDLTKGHVAPSGDFSTAGQPHATRSRKSTPQSSAPVVDEALLKRAYEVVHHELDCPSIGGNGDKDCKCDAVPFLRDLESALTGRG